MSALKKIEEKHSGTHYPCTDDPCDVVKLARALDKVGRRLLLIAGVLETKERRTVVTQWSDEAEGTLEEVAGE